RHTRCYRDWSSDVCSSDLLYRPLPPVTALPSNAEKSLLLLMMAGEPWRSRVVEAVDAEEFEFPVYRTVFEALADDAPDRLDETEIGRASCRERVKGSVGGG